MDTESLYKEACELTANGDHANALRLYRRLTETKQDARFFIAYGVCLQQLSHWKQSIAPLEKGIALKPHYCEGDARLYLAESYLNAGEKSKAIAQWEIVSKLSPEYPSYENVPNEAKRLLKKYA